GAEIIRLRRWQRVEDSAERADDRHADLLHFGDDWPLRAAEAEAEYAEDVVALDLLLRGRDGAVSAQPVVGDRHRDFAAVDAAALSRPWPRRRWLGASRRGWKPCHVGVYEPASGPDKSVM